MLKPLHDLVYLKAIVTEETTASGLILGSRVEEHTGTVVALGPGTTYEGGLLVPIDLNIGDVVLFSEHTGQTFDVDGEKLIALRESQILAVIS
jgi:chaperonin GroES